jgi:hypothetical protein
MVSGVIIFLDGGIRWLGILFQVRFLRPESAALKQSSEARIGSP